MRRAAPILRSETMFLWRMCTLKVFLLGQFVLSCWLGDQVVWADEARQQTIVPPPNPSQMSESGPYLSAGLDRKTLRDSKVLRAMSRVPRDKFVPADVAKQAYEDRALPIGQGQTISQPFIVALMTQEAQIVPGAKVLEIGTGSGYQAAVLCELGAKVFSIEIVPELAARSAETLKSLGYDSVTVRQGDGWAGWDSEAPFDAILVTASAPRPPEKLIKQLGDHGRMVIPIEQPGADGEQLLIIERRGNDLITRDLGAVRFVPITGTAREEVDLGVDSDEPLKEVLGIDKK